MADAKPIGDVFPAIKYRDAPEALGWLEKAFGLKPGLVVPGPEGTIAHAELSIGTGGVMLGSVREPGEGDPWAAVPMGVYVAVDDVDAHYARAVAAGARIADEIQDTDYGARQYSAFDPEGNLWCFGSYRPGDTEV